MSVQYCFNTHKTIIKLFNFLYISLEIRSIAKFCKAASRQAYPDDSIGKFRYNQFPATRNCGCLVQAIEFKSKITRHNHSVLRRF